MKITKASNRCLKLIEESEGFSPKPYLCPAGVPTIGIGSTFYFDTKKRVSLTDKPIDIQEARRLLDGHVNTVFAPLADKLCRDDLNQNEFDALVDFLYNAGPTYINKQGKAQYYNLFHHINERMPEDKLRAYWESLAITGGGKKLKGLVIRRKKESDLFFS